MMRAFTVSTLVIQAVLIGTPATATDNGFISPPEYSGANRFDSPTVWQLGDTHIIEWETTYTEFTIALWHEWVVTAEGARIGPILFQTKDGAGLNTFSWKVDTYNNEVSEGPIYFFWLSKSADDPVWGGPFSHTSSFFNITNKAIEAENSSSTKTEGQTSTEQPTKTVTLSAPEGEQRVGGLSTGEKAGIGVAAVSVVGIAAVAAFMIRAWRRRMTLAPEQQETTSNEPNYQELSTTLNGQPHELQGRQYRHELGG